METITKLTIAAGVLLLLSGCNVTDPIYNTPHPDKGQITLTADWSEIGEQIAKPSTYSVTVGDYSATLTGDVNTIENLFPAGSYKCSLYNQADDISVSGTVATVSDDTQSAGFISLQPGWLFTFHNPNTVVEQDTDHNYTALMQQQVRQLTLIIAPTGGSADQIESITAELSGLASAWDFATNTPSGTAAKIKLNFTKITSGSDAGKWSSTVRLLGTNGDKQQLSGMISYIGGIPVSHSLESDMSSGFAGFNTRKNLPLTLDGQLPETPTETGFTVTINGWHSVTGGNVVAN